MAAHKKDIKDKFAPLLTLQSDRLQYINNLIFKEHKIAEAIKKLQNDYGLFKEYKVSTLRIYLHEYKKNWQESWYQFNLEGSVHVSDEVPAKLKDKVPKDMGDTIALSEWIPYSKVRILLKEAVTKFDAMQELERLAMMQYDRVLKGMEYEAKLPTTSIDAKGRVAPLSGLDKTLRPEIESLHGLFKSIILLQMDLGIRNKVEVPQTHLHLHNDPHQQQLIADFNKMKSISDITTQALELISSK